MGAGPTGLDQSWGFADPHAAKRAGIEVISMYLSWDTSKNITKSDVLAYHGVGIGVILNWESQAGAPLKGAAQGKSDAIEAVRLAKALIHAVGYKPANRLIIYFSCDTDTRSSQYPQIEAYYRDAKTVCNAAGFGIGVYGEADLVQHLANKGITDAEWQTYAWSGGRLSSVTDFYQYLNGQRLGGADVDFDRVIHPKQLGAWWPKVSTLNTAPTPTQTQEANPLADLTSAQLQQIAKAVWHYQGTLPQETGELLNHARKRAASADDKLDSVATAVHNVVPRVAALQKAVAAIVPANASAVADAVVTKIKALAWRAH